MNIIVLVNILGFAFASAIVGSCTVLMAWNRSLAKANYARAKVAVICGFMALAGLLLAVMQGVILAWRLSHFS